ncbi:unnamed protein product [Phytophthora fragariaefolia]|uniref:Unnamed protein product n=1 Tax=Phytophthora fragariaefolia TaxID=1490495 RepID=A0A9W6Y5T6_9STRA|nr:unnamed protein product [Phytophthora fragariaefolia]
MSIKRGPANEWLYGGLECHLLADTDDFSTFAAFESDAENDDGDDDDASVDGFEAADVQLPAPPEMRFSPDARAVMDNTASAPRTPVAHQEKYPEFKPKTPELIRNDRIKPKGVTARGLCIFLGLLLARSIVPNPNKEKLAHHWKTTHEGALPRGGFGQSMTRDRFMHISRNLHFSRNDDERAAKDQAWKLRPVIDALQDRFAAGFMPPVVMAFDEAMLPSRSTFNTMRVFEVYCGRKERGGTTASTDCNSGPAAVVRNLQHVFGPTAPPNGQMRLVVIDRFYSSVLLCMQLLTMGFYSIGTVRTDRQGLSTKLIPKKKKGEKKKPPKIPKNRPANIERGTFIVTDA